MQFLSIEFAVFFLVFFPIYWLFGNSRHIQNILLLAAGVGSLFVINEMFAVILAVYTLLIYAIAINIYTDQRRSPDKEKAGKGWLIVGIVFGIGQLAFFKYSDFFRLAMPESIRDSMADLIMPLGISYYTFQSLAYLNAVYKRRIHLLHWNELLLYLSFFPTLTSGPIWRADTMKTIAGEHAGAYEQLRSVKPRQIIRPALAISLILLGIVKKWCLAGNLGDSFVDPIFENPLQYDCFSVLLAVYGYSVQLFLDFSGYTDLAIGIAMLLGFQLPPNFVQPFLAHNLREFWARWHISLSTWVRDYIYIPLGGNRKGFFRMQLNLLIAMALSGIWHGAGLTYLIWGLLHGFGLVLLNFGDKIFGGKNRLAQNIYGRYLGIFSTITFVSFVFIVFRAPTLSDAALVLEGIFHNPNSILIPPLSVALCAATMILALIGYRELLHIFDGFVHFLERTKVEYWVLPITLVLLFVIVVAPSGVPGFIYASF